MQSSIDENRRKLTISLVVGQNKAIDASKDERYWIVKGSINTEIGGSIERTILVFSTAK